MNCAERLIAHFGNNAAEAGRRIDACRQAVNQWKKNGIIPVSYATRIDTATGGVVSRMMIYEEQELYARLRVERSRSRRKKGARRRKGS